MKNYVLDGTRLTLGSFELDWILNQDSVENVKKFITEAIRADRKNKTEKPSLLEKEFHIPHRIKLRRCFVDDKRAWFHRWCEKEDVFVRFEMLMCKEITEEAKRLLKDRIIPPYGKVEVVKTLRAIVEYEDGTVAEVEPTKIKFEV